MRDTRQLPPKRFPPIDMLARTRSIALLDAHVADTNPHPQYEGVEEAPRPRWGLILGDIERQQDLQELIASYLPSTLGGL